MKFTYIDTPKTSTHQVKAFVKQFTDTGEWNKWVVVRTSKGKTPKELASMRQRLYAYRRRYVSLQWEIHRGKDNFSIICRKEQ